MVTRLGAHARRQTGRADDAREESDARIIKALSGNPLGEHSASFQAEMSSRLRRSLEGFRESSDRAAATATAWTERLYWATIGLFALTVAVVLLTGVLIFFALRSH